MVFLSNQKIQYQSLILYLNHPHQLPINAHPRSSHIQFVTMEFHHSLSYESVDTSYMIFPFFEYRQNNSLHFLLDHNPWKSMDYQDTSPSDQLLFVSKYLDSYVPTSFALSYVDIVLLTRQY